MEWKDFMPAALIPAGLLTLGTLGHIFGDQEKNTSVPFYKRIFQDTTIKKDTVKYTTFKDLPLKAGRKIEFNTSEGSWMSA